MELKSTEAATGLEEIAEIDLYSDLATYTSSPDEQQDEVERIVLTGVSVEEEPEIEDPTQASEGESGDTPFVFEDFEHDAAMPAQGPPETPGDPEHAPDESEVTEESIAHGDGLLVLESFTPEKTAGGAVCSACGEESGAGDLLCIACGAFLGEFEGEQPGTPVCDECGESVIAEEVFCPSCGAVVGD